MKLRIKGNSIRLRLTKSEVEQFGTTGEVKETVDVGPGQIVMTYRLRAVTEADEPRAEFKDGTLSVLVYKNAAEAWAGSDQIGIEATQQTGDGKQLRIFIEKDFECLAERAGEDDSDAFPNPRAASGI